MKKHPIQPLEIDAHGVLRFKANAIVQYLLDKGGLNMNDLAIVQFSKEDRQQFAQLIGYSLSGYGDLGYVTDDAYGVADKMYSENLSEKDAKIAYFETELIELRSTLRKPIARLFGIHPDDLEE
jgi:hypothetical protein